MGTGIRVIACQAIDRARCTLPSSINKGWSGIFNRAVLYTTNRPIAIRVQIVISSAYCTISCIDAYIAICWAKLTNIIIRTLIVS